MSDKPGVEGLKAISDLAKQIITLGSVLIGVTVTFADKFQSRPAGQGIAVSPELGWAWIAYIVSVLFAVATLMAVAGSLNEIDTTGAETNPRRTNTKTWGAPMLLAFVTGLGFTAAAGWSGMRQAVSP